MYRPDPQDGFEVTDWEIYMMQEELIYNIETDDLECILEDNDE